jgi:hypothetical protein
MAEYLHARLIKTAELSPEQSYVFAAYPHGISAIGGWLSFATEATGFSTLFPGVKGGAAELAGSVVQQQQQQQQQHAHCRICLCWFEPSGLTSRLPVKLAAVRQV